MTDDSNNDKSIDDMISKYFNNGSIINSFNNEKDDNSLDIERSRKLNDNNMKDDPTENEIIVGIDLGTTNSCVSIYRNNNLEIIPDENGNKTVPSIVSFTNKSQYVGHDAKNQKEINPKNVFYEVKRLIGRKFDEPNVMNDKELLTYNIESNEDGNICLRLANGEMLAPEKISSIVLMKLKNMASTYLNKEIKKAVITVPAYFNDTQRQATKDSATIAGLECVRIINEPTAAALAYGLMNRSMFNKESEKKDDELKSMNVVVYDLGGGTTDCSVLNITDGVFEVLGSVGNTHLGGADFDNRLIRFCLDQFKLKYGIEKMPDLSALSLQKLRKSCENAKILLSTSLQTIIAVKDFYDSKDLFITMTRDKYNNLCRDLLILCLKSLDDVLNSCGLKKSDIDEIILVGGMTRMLSIRENIKMFFNGKEPNCTVNPDEVVAAGAAIQAYILSHRKDPFSEFVTLLDIVSLSLGVETIGGVMDVIIPRNSFVPITKKKIYTTDTDYEKSVSIKVYEGERKMTKNNYCVGEFELTGIDPVKKGIPEIEVKFSVDINGIITVTAEDKDKNNKKGITISGNKGRLKQDEIDRLVEEAKEFDLKDKIERHKKQLYYQIDDMCASVISNVNNPEFKLSDKDKKIITCDIEEVNKWLHCKKYFEIEENDYIDIIKKIESRYGTLILKGNMLSDTVNASHNNTADNSTTIYGEDEEEVKQVFEKIENEELGSDKMGDIEKQELVQIRSNLIELCNNIYEIITSNTLLMDDKDKKELRDYIDDTLLWIYSHSKPKKSEYKQKIDEINDSCNKILEEYDKNNKNIYETNSVSTNLNKKDELEQLCFVIKSSIEYNTYALDEKEIKELLNIVNINLDWTLDNDAKKIEISDSEYNNRIEELNNMCNNLYNKMIGININPVNNIIKN